jgi:hypothetical protein
MNQEKDFFELAKEKFAELEKQEADIKAELESIQKQKSPLKNYMKNAGLIEVKRRGPRRRKGVERA